MLRLALDQAGHVVTGTFQMEMAATAPTRVPAFPARTYIGVVEGSVDDDGTLGIEGTTTLDGRPSFEIREWRSTRGADGAMTGRFVLSEPDLLGLVPLAIEYQLLGLHR
jgi:hypothetical protein